MMHQVPRFFSFLIIAATLLVRVRVEACQNMYENAGGDSMAYLHGIDK